MILVNGVQGDRIAVQDRGLHYGDGLFETIAVIDGIPCLWRRHMQRLMQGCRRLALPEPDPGLLKEEAQRVSAGHERAVLKIIVTRGGNGRGYRAGKKAGVTRIVARYDWPEYPAEFLLRGIRLRVCNTRLGNNPALAGIKHLNRLEQVLARSEWHDPRIAEGLMLDQNDYVIEGTQSNLFVVKQGCLLTPELSRCGIKGVMREWIQEQGMALGIECSETDLTLQDVMEADELFMCNSLMGIWPVRSIGEADFAIGPVTRRLLTVLGNSRGAGHA